MSANPIRNPLQGERVVGLSPTPAPRITDWNRRLNLFTGRALTSAALTAEQEGRTGRLAQRGQTVSSGVVTGLETDFVSEGQSRFLRIAAGFGLAASGEDVFLAKAVRLAVGSLPVYTTAALLDGVTESGTGEPAAQAIVGQQTSGAAPLRAGGAASQTGELAARRLGPTLDELIAKKVAIPQVGVVVLQPVSVDQLTNFDANDPCEEDPADDAFSDEQWLDGCRIIYYAWPTEWLPLPATGDAWRNRLAYAIFEAEASNTPDQVMPWELAGLPIGLIAFDEAWNPLFADRYAVVRAGGKPRRRTPIVPEAGHEFLWEARLKQFSDHVASLDPGSKSPADLAKEFRHIPPVGLLPASALKLESAPSSDSRTAGSDFFPGSYTVKVHPAPVEQLDWIARGSGSLAAIDTFTPDQVTIAVPVPQIWYETDLLKVEKIDPSFQQTIDRFAHERALWLKRRLDVRAAQAALEPVLTGKPVIYPEPDPDAVEDEQPADNQIDQEIEAFKNPEEAYGTSGTGKLVVDDLESLKKELAALPGVSTELPELEKPETGLQKFTADLQAKADHANDLIDTGFLHVQTDIYRMRQHMLGNTAASRLAISPALAEIAQGTTGLATEEKIESYLQSLKEKLPPPERSGGGTPPPPPPSHAPEHPPPPHERPETHEAGAPHPARPSPPHRLGPTPHVFVAGAFRPRPPIHTEERRPTPAHAAPVVYRGEPMLFGAAQIARVRAENVRQQRPIVGGFVDRTTSVAERLSDPATEQVRAATVASKVRVISNFRKGATPLNIAVDDIEIPGFLDEHGNEARKKIGDIDDTAMAEVLEGKHDPIPENPAEGQIFASGVRAIEHTVAVLRLMEQRVQIYLEAINLCHEAIDKINASAGAAASRLEIIAGELAQARHDTAVAKALTAEEQSRLDRINARRDQILKEQVRLLVYYRPRTIQAINDLPRRWLDPGFATPSIPSCMARHITAPDELREFVDLLREAPISWLRYVPQLIDHIDRIDTLHQIIIDSKSRANFKLYEAPVRKPRTRTGPLAPHITAAHDARRSVVTNKRTNTAQIDLTGLSSATWKESRHFATQTLSIGDLADLAHDHPEVRRASAAEIEDIYKVAAALYSDFCAVPPIPRLNWAERLTQIGSTVNLASLASLPNWNTISALERREMQALTDWLFGRINPAEAEALDHINDLVKVCILLASHAPVTEIIAGDVIHDTAATVGAHVSVTADPSRVRIGMHVLLYHANRPVARGVVEDLAHGVATARVLHVTSPHITLAHHTKAHFATKEAFRRHPLTSSLKV
jgi:hypothetical protein